MKQAEQSLNENKQQYSRIVDELEDVKKALIQAAEQGEKELAWSWNQIGMQSLQRWILD